MDDSLVQGPCRELISATRLGNCGGVHPTGVVVVGGAGPAGRRPGEAAPTLSTHHQTGQQVLRAVGDPLGGVLAPFDEDGLGGIEQAPSGG